MALTASQHSEIARAFERVAAGRRLSAKKQEEYLHKARRARVLAKMAAHKEISKKTPLPS
jgi:hypothetical protein